MEPVNLAIQAVTWVFSKEMHDLLNSMLEAGGTMLRSTSTVGDVPKILKQVTGPV